MSSLNIMAGAYSELNSHRIQLQSDESFDNLLPLSTVANDSNMIFHELRNTLCAPDQVYGPVGMFVNRLLASDPDRVMSLEVLAPSRRMGDITDLMTSVKNLSEEIFVSFEDQNLSSLPAADLSLINTAFGQNLNKVAKPFCIPNHPS